MKKYSLNAARVKKNIYSGHIKMGGANPEGDKIKLNNYYVEFNNAPYFIICGEFHYSRYDSTGWEEEILKMKACGINTLSTYIIWNHHEEEEGKFIWTRNKNLRLFVELCAKNGMKVIIRIGPFAHGEVRNGGFPDWLYGRPFEVRSNDEGYLYYVERLYKEIAGQANGLFFKDGGPIIGVQLENEYMAAGAPWETTPIQTLEWISGKNGKSHMRILKDMAVRNGFEVPIYTCTGWDKAPILEDEILPLYGGYAFWPWIYYEDVEKHPASREYLFRDYHCNSIKDPGFQPEYEPERYPFACCEMGGGMQVWYIYRFTVPPESVEAMALMKAAGGCNFIGYYMFHGGSNPVGKFGYLNERTTPKISYDFQAPVGEFGQIRESYKRLKLLHFFISSYQEELCSMASVIPEGADALTPYDTETVRYAARVGNGSGFLFLNNYQDHVDMKDHDNFKIEVCLEKEKITIPEQGGMTLKRDVCCILPFNLRLSDSIILKYSTTQLITNLEHEGQMYYFFFIPEGMKGEYCFEKLERENIKIINGELEICNELLIANISGKEKSFIEVADHNGRKITICTVTREQSLNLWKADMFGEKKIILSNGNVVIQENGIKITSLGQENINLEIFPPLNYELSTGKGILKETEDGNPFDRYEIRLSRKRVEPRVHMIRDNKAVIKFTRDDFRDINELIMNVRYSGDVGYAYIDGKLINDNFCNGGPWEIGLQKFSEELIEKGMYIHISPVNRSKVVKRDAVAEENIAGVKEALIESIDFVPEYTSILIKKKIEWRH